MKEVQEALKADKLTRIHLFAAMRKRGILGENQTRMAMQKDLHLIRERDQGKHDLVVCSYCSGFFAKAYFSRHRAECRKLHPQTEQAHISGIPPVCVETNTPDEFQTEVLDRLRRDEIGNLCRTDKVILELGKHEYAQTPNSKQQNTKVIKDNMRRLGEVLCAFRKVSPEKPEATGEDLLQRANFKRLQEALDECTHAEDNATMSAKRVALGYLLKTVAKTMKGVYFSAGSEEAAKEVDIWATVLDFNWPYMFSKAQYKVETRRKEKLRRPAALPPEEDVAKLRTYNVQEMKKMVDDSYKFYSAYEFNRLRALVVCRLTFFNGRRGGEPASLTLKEWEEADQGVWVGDVHKRHLNDPLDAALMEKLKLTFQEGKGRKLVPLLIPQDTVPAIKKLIETRVMAGINPKNLFLFPSTQYSLRHVEGGDMLREVVTAAGVSDPSRLTATTNRHRVSTLYEILDLPEKQHAAFYEHMGHSAEVNRSVYACPPAVKEICQVGKFLDSIDSHCEGKLLESCIRSICMYFILK